MRFNIKIFHPLCCQVAQQYSHQDILNNRSLYIYQQYAQLHILIFYVLFQSTPIQQHLYSISKIKIYQLPPLLFNPNYKFDLHNVEPQMNIYFNYKIKQNNPLALPPMKQVPYSPFNRSYKYMCLQNQLAHNKNKKSVKGLVDSNLSVYHDMFNANSTNNSSQFYHANNSKQRSVSQSINGSLRGNLSGLTTRTLGDSRMGKLKQQPLTIHMNKRYNSRKQYQIAQQNQRIKRKLSQTKCRVVPYKQTQKHYSNAKEYKEIAMRYDKQYKNKQLICFAQTSLTSTYAQSDPNTGRYLCRASSARKARK